MTDTGLYDNKEQGNLTPPEGQQGLLERQDRQEQISDQKTKRYRQVQELNQEPLNQAALKWLGKINKFDKKQTINESYQHIFQLMWWGLEEANLQFPNKRQTEIFEEILLEILGANNQLGEFRYLQGPPEEPRVDEYDLQSATDAKEAALKLIEALNMALSSDENLCEIYPPTNLLGHFKNYSMGFGETKRNPP